MDGQEFEKIEKEKDLGLMINSRLLSSEQVTEARKNYLGMLCAINRNVSYNREEVIIKL